MRSLVSSVEWREKKTSEKSIWKAISFLKSNQSWPQSFAEVLPGNLGGQPSQACHTQLGVCTDSIMHTLFTCTHTQKNTMSFYHRAVYRGSRIGVEGLSYVLPAVLLVGTVQFHLPGCPWALSGLKTVY